MDSITDDPSIIEAHRKIANFAIDIYGPNPPYSDLQLSKMKYRYSFDWLMPVYLKLKKAILDLCNERSLFYHNLLTSTCAMGDIHFLFNNIVESIDWYNQTKEK